MDMFKLFMVIPTISAEISKAMADRELTIKEIFDILDTTLKQLLGKGLGEIGLAIKKLPNGKVKIEFVI
jgi:hypothetical protein